MQKRIDHKKLGLDLKRIGLNMSEKLHTINKESEQRLRYLIIKKQM